MLEQRSSAEILAGIYIGCVPFGRVNVLKYYQRKAHGCIVVSHSIRMIKRDKNWTRTTLYSSLDLTDSLSSRSHKSLLKNLLRNAYQKLLLLLNLTKNEYENDL